MKPIVSIIMGSTSDLPVMEKAAAFLNDMQVPFEMNALSAHRTPAEVEKFAKEAAGRGLKVIIAGAGMAAALPGVIAANTTLPVIGIPIKDASRHSCSYGCYQRGDECRYPCRADACLVRRNTGAEVCRLQRRLEEQNRESQPRPERGEIRV